MTDPEARRAYRILGVIHGLLFGAMAFTRALDSGGVVVATILAVAFGGVGLGIFWYLGNEHYHGNVPGDGGLAHFGENDE